MSILWLSIAVILFLIVTIHYQLSIDYIQLLFEVSISYSHKLA